MKRQRRNPSNALELSLIVLLAILAVAYPIWRGFLKPTSEVDFRFYWLAGYAWAHGWDPYSPSFTKLGGALLPPGSHWFYPPTWWPLSRLLALLDPGSSLQVWRALASPIIIASTLAVVLLLTRGLPPRRRALLAAAGSALASSIEPTGDVLTGGQVSPVLVYAGIALIICSFATCRRDLLVGGLVLVAMKPQVGIAFFLAFAFSRTHWRAVTAAGLIVLALSSPQFVSFGLVTTCREMIYSFQDHARLNIPLVVTGPIHLLARAGIDLPIAVSSIFALLIGAVAGLLLRRDPHSLPVITLLITGIACFTPLHNYDMTILVLCAILLLAVDGSLLCVLLVSAALAANFRPSRLEAMFSIPVYMAGSGGVITYSITALAFLALAIRRLLSRRPVPTTLPSHARTHSTVVSAK